MLRIDGETVTPGMGGVEETFTLGRKGKAESDAGRITLRCEKEMWLRQLTARLGKSDVSEYRADAGLVDETQKKTAFVFEATVELGLGIASAHLADARCTATAGKSG